MGIRKWAWGKLLKLTDQRTKKRKKDIWLQNIPFNLFLLSILCFHANYPAISTSLPKMVWGEQKHSAPTFESGEQISPCPHGTYAPDRIVFESHS
jgi:hypothetical protein